MRSFIGIFLVILSIISCNPYKKTSLSNEVFLSHRIFSQNYHKYVYLVRDGDSTYLLDDVSVDYLNGSDTVLNGADTVSVIRGTIRPLITPKDSSKVLKGKKYSDDNTRNVEIFLTKKNDRVVEKYRRLEIKEKDIQKVRMQRVKGGPRVNILIRAFLVLVVIFSFILGTLFLILINIY